MKTTFLYGLILVCSLSLLSSTCSHHDDDDGWRDDDDGSFNDNLGEIQQVIDQAESGVWRVTSFIDSGQDETHHFNGVSFTFQSNGSLVASGNNSSLTGSWSVTDSNSNDDSSDDIDFNIFFNVSESNKFEDLNDDWDIVLHSNDLIRLRDVSGGNGGTDILTFERF